MRANRAKPQDHPREIGARADYSQEILRLMARVLTLTGHSPTELAAQFHSICRRLKEPKRPWDPSTLKFIWDLPDVIARWHADPQYLDSGGTPLALPLTSSGPSLTSLIERVLPEGDLEAVIEALRWMKAIRRKGTRYAPTGRQLAYQHQRLVGWLHGLTMLLGLLRTVEHNIAHPEGPTLLERAAMTSGFPVRYLPEMHQRFKDRAASFLWQFDGEMRKRQSSSAKADVVRLGIGIFAFEDPLMTGTSDRTSRRRALTARRARARSKVRKR